MVDLLILDLGERVSAAAGKRTQFDFYSNDTRHSTDDRSPFHALHLGRSRTDLIDLYRYQEAVKQISR